LPLITAFFNNRSKPTKNISKNIKIKIVNFLQCYDSALEVSTKGWEKA